MKKTKRLKAMIINLLKVLGGLLVVWGMWGVIQLNKQLTIKDIAYDNVFSVVNKLEGYTVYLKENGEYEPYLVLSKNYNSEGNVLLLRKYLLDEPRIYNENERFAAYYENSKVDNFLNGEFLYSLGELRENIKTSNLEITDESSVGSAGDETTTIPRKVFLLSHEEMVAGSSGMAAKEGKKLLYFMGFHTYIATKKSGEAEIYWLRTPYTEHDTTVWEVRENGLLGYAPLWDWSTQSLYTYNIRPAFCLAKDTKLERKEGIEKGKKVFVLKGER
jgi:hypothetical protein